MPPPPPQILATPPPPHHFLLPSSSYFTGALYDHLALFMHKHRIRTRRIHLVGRGVTREDALACPTVVIEMWGCVERARALFLADEPLVAKVPRQVRCVEFVGLIGGVGERDDIDDAKE